MRPIYDLSLNIDMGCCGGDCGAPSKIFMGDELLAVRPYDGSDREDIVKELVGVFGKMLREATGWLEKEPDYEDYGE